MLSGRLPFHSDTPVGYLRMHMLEEPPPFRAVAHGLHVPPQVEGVVMKALTKDRNQRYGSVLDFARELTAAAQQTPTPAMVEKTVQTPTPAPPQRIVETPTVKPQASKPAGGVLFSGAAASGALAAARAPQFRMVAEPRSKMKFVVIGVVAIILIGAGVWYSLQPAAKNPSPDGSVKKGDVSSSVKAGSSQGEAKVNPKDGLKYVWIPPGTFMMGCSPGDNECQWFEKPAHQEIGRASC